MSLRRLRLLFLTYGTAIGFVLPWNVLQLTEAGLDPGVTGAVLGVAALATLVAYPVWGIIADTLIGRGRTLVLTGVLAAGCSLGILVSADDPARLSLFIILLSVCVAPWAPVSDALALTAVGSQPRAYGRLRSWTSLGWVVAVLGAGGLWALWGPAPVRLLSATGALALAAVAAGKRSSSGGMGRPARPSRDGLTPGAFRLALRASPVFLPFLGVLFVSSVATNAAYAFVALRILDEGGGPLVIGIAAALPAIVEIPVFGSIGRLSERFGLRALFVAGCLVSAAQVLIVAVAPIPAIIALVRLVDGIGFALRYSSVVLIAGAALPERLRATGQSMTWLITGGIAPIVSGPVGGLIYASLGGAALFAACAALLSAAGGLAWLVLAPISAARRAAASGAGPEGAEVEAPAASES